jgi:hypothetical protein
MKRAAFYVRVSTVEQHPETQLSLIVVRIYVNAYSTGEPHPRHRRVVRSYVITCTMNLLEIP